MSAASSRETEPDGTPRADSFPPISLPRAADAVTAALIDGIRAGAAPIGSYLPRDQDLARHFGVSRAVVRESMDRLRRAGILEIRRGNRGGAIVRSLTIPTDLLTSQTELHEDRLADLLEARRTIETACVQLAARRATDQDLEELDELVEALADAHSDPEAFIELDVRFHLRIASASGNSELEAFLAAVFRGLAAVRSVYPRKYGSMEAAEEYQRDTLVALRAADPILASESIERHLRGLEEHFLGQPIVLR